MSAAKTTGPARPESARPGSTKPAAAKPASDAERGRFKPFLSERMRQVLRARLQEMAGFLLGLLALAIFALLASYAPSDPSLNTAGNGGEIKNWLGAPGALAADLLRQAFGYAAYLFVVIPIAWGWRLGAHRPLRRPFRRAVTALLGVLAAAVALAGVEQPGVDPLAPPPGGSLGLLGLDKLTALVTSYDPLAASMAAGVAAGMSAFFLFLSMGAPLSDWLEGLLRLRRGMALVGRGIGVGAGAVRAWGGSLRRLAPGRRPSDAAPDEELRPESGFAVERRSPFFTEEADEPGADAGQNPPFDEPPQQAESPPRVGAGAGPTLFNITKRPPADEPPEVYELPPLDLLQAPDPREARREQSPAALEATAKELEGVLADFGVRGEIHKAHPGPVVTLYELEPAPGTKSARVIGLADDIARSMSANSVRVAVVPGRNVIGIELPNQIRETVLLRELLADEAFARHGGKLVLALGKDIGGHPVAADLARFPHLLVAGTTGSGKSVAINTMILSLLYRLPPERCRFIMIDPKMLELSVYEGIPHLLAPVVTDPKKAVVALKWTVREMEERYRNMSKLGVRNVDGYNARLRQARADGESLTRKVQTGFDPDTGKPLYEEQPLDLTELPYIVVIVDEMADLMLVAGKDIEAAIQRLAQMARAAGIHLVMATQRPSVDVITGTIKANFPTRISFQVTSKIDSRTILGEQGAEQLLGQGDMLYMAGGGRITRVHGPFVSDHEVEMVVRHLKAQGEPAYVDAVLEDEDGEGGDWDGDAAAKNRDGGGSGDELYDKAVAVVCRERKASTSFIQRQLRIGYNSAARLIERMEAEGVVSKPNHAGKRDVLARNIDEE